MARFNPDRSLLGLGLWTVFICGFGLFEVAVLGEDLVLTLKAMAGAWILAAIFVAWICL